MQRISTPSNPWQDLRPRDVVSFSFEGATVKAEVLRLDEKAHVESPLGAPYRVYVLSAEAGSGYVEGREYTVRAACLVPDGDLSDRPLRDPQPGPLVSAIRSTLARLPMTWKLKPDTRPTSAGTGAQVWSLDPS